MEKENVRVYRVGLGRGPVGPKFEGTRLEPIKNETGRAESGFEISEFGTGPYLIRLKRANSSWVHGSNYNFFFGQHRWDSLRSSSSSKLCLQEGSAFLHMSSFAD